MKRIALGLIAAIMGAAILSWTWNTSLRIKSSAKWPTTQGQVVSSSIVNDSTRIRGGGYNRLYRAAITYQYTVNGKQYKSDTFTFGIPHSFANRADAEHETQVFPVGKTVDVHFDPRNPATASLESGTVPQQFTLLGWMSGLFLVAGLVALVSGILNLRRRVLASY